MLRGLWLLGAVSILTMLAGSLWSLYRLRRSGTPWIAGQAIAETMAKEAGVNRKVTVILHERTAMPATMGVLRPTILLPPEAPHWSEPDRRRVLLHELEHIRRGDWWIHLSARAVCIVYWFHPLVWIAWRQLGVEAERACDDAVVRGTDRADYAEQLLTLAERLSSPPPRLMLSMANRSDLSTRVRAILNPTQQRGRAGTVAAATIIIIVALVMGTIASLQAVAGRPGPVSDRAVSGHPVAGAAAPRNAATAFR
jgi:beta-lactamase regulating signal transducer with metallopeptidase domain